jgi:tetratricopeptide (TPR) repeat protein
MKPLCFVLMPFGRKPAGDGRVVDFDAVYRELIQPAIEAAGLEPLRADQEITGGLIHKAMFERLILCEYAVADMTTANANVFYELGVRHTTRSFTTVPVFAAGWGQLPFDVNGLRAVPYQLGTDGAPATAAADSAVLSARLQAARDGDPASDSPVFQLLEGFPDIQRLKTDVFRDRVRYAEGLKQRLAAARDSKNLDALQAIEASLGTVADADAAVVVDLLLSYRALSAWPRMIELVAHLAQPLARTVLVQEQLGFALNRAGRSLEAERVLRDVIQQHGASSETCGLLGRVYKDRWEAALAAGQAPLARGLLEQAIATYLQGFEADWRDAYPGVNALTLMELRDPPDPRQAELLPVVTYAVRRRILTGKPDYWDQATLLELAVLARDPSAGNAALAHALAALREPWEAETTARNLRLIRAARERRGDVLVWAGEIENALGQVAGPERHA